MEGGEGGGRRGGSLSERAARALRRLRGGASETALQGWRAARPGAQASAGGPTRPARTMLRLAACPMNSFSRSALEGMVKGTFIRERTAARGQGGGGGGGGREGGRCERAGEGAACGYGATELRPPCRPRRPPRSSSADHARSQPARVQPQATTPAQASPACPQPHTHGPALPSPSPSTHAHPGPQGSCRSRWTRKWCRTAPWPSAAQHRRAAQGEGT